MRIRPLTLALPLAAAIAAPAPVGAKDTKGKGKSALVFYDDPQNGVSFQYPPAWRNITIAEDASKAEAATEDRQSKVVIEALPKPPTGGVVGVLEKKLPKGASTGGSGDWKCLEGDIDNGARHAAWCGRRVGDKELLLVGVYAANLKAFQKIGGIATVLAIGKSAKNFKAAGEE